jgi:hypothetical protein
MIFICPGFQRTGDNYFRFDLIFGVLTPLSAIFQLYHGGQFCGGKGRREPPTIDKQLVNFITCGCESSAPFL